MLLAFLLSCGNSLHCIVILSLYRIVLFCIIVHHACAYCIVLYCIDFTGICHIVAPALRR